MCDCNDARGRAARLLTVAQFIQLGGTSQVGVARRLRTLSRAPAADWDEDPGHLAQALDAVLDSALAAFQSDQCDQGIAIVVGASATVDALLEAMGLPDADEEPDEPDPPAMGMYAAGHEHFEGRAADNSAWDAGAALSGCASSKTPGSCYGSICAGRKSGPVDQQSSWALPHHKTPGSPPNAAAVCNALARLSQTQGLTNQAEARRHLEAHMAAISATSSNSARPPRDNLVRGVLPFELRAAESDGGMPVMTGHFAVFNRWTEIDSIFEGRFLESIAPGAFAKTFKENRAAMRVLFNHGRDPQIGNKVLGPIDELEEDKTGARYEVPLYDTSYNRDLLPALGDGQYGASFRFRVLKEDLNQKPDRSDSNPDGIPERTIREAQVLEFGPVTFPAYADATAGIRSLTDEFLVQQLVGDPQRLLEVLHHYQPAPATALPEPGAELAHSAEGSRDDSPRRLVVVRNPKRRR